MLQKLTKVDPVAWRNPFIHLLVTIKPTIVFLGKGQQNQRGAGSPPSSWDLDGGWGGARRHEALIRQNRAHGQIHCHVSAMSASSVHVIGGAFQVSWPAWCSTPPLPTLVARPQAVDPSDATQSLFEQMSLCPQADSFSS